jgi:hypothetical protein
VNCTLQLPEASVQLPEIGVTEPPEAVKVTAPPGVLVIPGELSVTVAVQLLGWLTLTGRHETVVFVERLLTTIVAGDAVWLPLCDVSEVDGT